MKTPRCLSTLALLLLLLLSLAGACESRPARTQPATPKRLIVVTTMTVLADLIRQVGDDKVAVQALVPAGQDVHTFQPTPGDIQTVSRARIPS